MRRWVLALLACGLLVAVLPGSAGAVRLRPVQRGYLALALRGVHLADAGWWNPAINWYRQRLYGGRDGAPATLWGSVHLFEAANAIELASPTLGHLQRVRNMARGAERYWNPYLRPRGGFGPHPDVHGSEYRAYFDDNGWWGLAFLDAYRATHDRRWLWDARRAYSFIRVAGWDYRHGGIWWDTGHTFKAGESLATGTLLAVELYGYTHEQYYLEGAREFVEWGRSHTWNDQDSLYGRHETDRTSMPYVQSPLAAADVIVCHINRDPSLCDRGEMLAATAARRFPELDMGPQYDAMYLRWLLYLYSIDHNPRWYWIAISQADRARANAGDGHGRWLRAWDGSSMWLHGGDPSMLQPHAATTMLFAWIAATPPPPGV